jgi:hypothetical protein
MPFKYKPSKAPREQAGRIREEDFIVFDEKHRPYFVLAGGLADQPLGELESDEARAAAIVEASKPRRIYMD